MIAPATVALATQLHVPIKRISALSGYQLLIVGALGFVEFSLFLRMELTAETPRPIVSVLAQKYGKRPQFLFAAFFGVIGTGICIGGFDQPSLKKSYHVILAGRIVQGIGTTAYESLSVAAIGDMFYLHERGLRTALLVLTLASTSSFVALIGGTMFEHLGARNLFVVLLPIQIFGLAGAVLCMPETQFRRDSVVSTTPVASTDAVMQEKQDGHDTTEGTSGQHTLGANQTMRRSFAQDMRVTSGLYNNDSMLKLLGEIFVHLLNPAVIWIQLVSAVLVVRLTILRLTTPTNLLIPHTVFLRRHDIHDPADLHATPILSFRLSKRLLFYRRPHRRHPGRLSRSVKRLYSPTARTPKQRCL
jgi:MFS family permease